MINLLVIVIIIIIIIIVVIIIILSTTIIINRKRGDVLAPLSLSLSLFSLSSLSLLFSLYLSRWPNV